jgi:hypothetical protein
MLDVLVPRKWRVGDDPVIYDRAGVEEVVTENLDVGDTCQVRPVDFIELIAMDGQAGFLFNESADDGSAARAWFENHEIRAVDRGEIDDPAGEVGRGLEESHDLSRYGARLEYFFFC